MTVTFRGKFNKNEIKNFFSTFQLWNSQPASFTLKLLWTAGNLANCRRQSTQKYQFSIVFHLKFLTKGETIETFTYSIWCFLCYLTRRNFNERKVKEPKLSNNNIENLVELQKNKNTSDNMFTIDIFAPPFSFSMALFCSHFNPCFFCWNRIFFA